MESRQASLSITNSRSSLRLTSIESVMPSSHLILRRPLLLLPPIHPSIRVFSNESTLHMRWPKYWSFSFSIIPSKEIPGLISFRKDWLDLLAVQGTLKSLLQNHSSKASILWRSAFFTDTERSCPNQKAENGKTGMQTGWPGSTTLLITISRPGSAWACGRWWRALLKSPPRHFSIIFPPQLSDSWAGVRSSKIQPTDLISFWVGKQVLSSSYSPSETFVKSTNVGLLVSQGSKILKVFYLSKLLPLWWASKPKVEHWLISIAHFSPLLRR